MLSEVELSEGQYHAVEASPPASPRLGAGLTPFLFLLSFIGAALFEGGSKWPVAYSSPVLA
jgi:hypothetical protein